MTGCESELEAKIVSYADDNLILCRGSAEEARRRMELLMDRLGLPVNQEKTTIVKVPDEAVSFLGYRIGRTYSRKTGKAYIGTWPAKEKVQDAFRSINEMTNRSALTRPVNELVRSVNRYLRGWANYFCLGPVDNAYKAVDAHTRDRVQRWLAMKHATRKRSAARDWPRPYLYEELGVLKLRILRSNLPWMKA